MAARDFQVTQRVAAEAAVKQIRPKTPGQAAYLEAIKTHIVTICVGPAGCGKSLLAASVAVTELKQDKIESIIVCRPLVECTGDKSGRSRVGFLPGGLGEKIAPFVAAARACIAKCLTPDELTKYETSGRIQYHPLEMMRGLTFSNSFVISDESQNMEYIQLHMLLTRFGENARVVVNGDLFQSDITDRDTIPPLYDVMKRLNGVPDIAIVQLTDDDIVRSPLVKEIEKRLR